MNSFFLATSIEGSYLDPDLTCLWTLERRPKRKTAQSVVVASHVWNDPCLLLPKAAVSVRKARHWAFLSYELSLFAQTSLLTTPRFVHIMHPPVQEVVQVNIWTNRVS